MSNEFTEKRHFIRMTTDAVITFKEHGNESVHQGQCVNLSAAGVLFLCHRHMLPGTLLDIKIAPEQPESEDVAPLNATIEVVRTQLSDNGGYAVAGEIKLVQ